MNGHTGWVAGTLSPLVFVFFGCTGTLEGVSSDGVSELAEESFACDTFVADPALSMSEGWKGLPYLPDGQFAELVVAARPGSGDKDAVLGISPRVATDFPDLLANIRFSEDGTIQVRDGGFYNKDVVYPYEAGAWYTFVFKFHYDALTYEVAVADCDGNSEVLATAATFRANATVGAQTHVSAWSLGGGLDVSEPTWSVSREEVAETFEEWPEDPGTPNPDPGTPTVVPGTFPNARTTGFRAAGLTESDLSPSGNTGIWIINKPGVYERFRHVGRIRVESTGVTIRNCLVLGGDHGSTSLITNVAGGQLLVENCKLDGGITTNVNQCANGVAHTNYIARRLDVSGCADGFKTGGDVLIEDCYVHDLHQTCPGGVAFDSQVCTHNDSIQQQRPGTSLRVRRNAFIGSPCRQNIHLILGKGGLDTLTVEDNFFSGFYSILAFGGGAIRSSVFQNNVLAGSSTTGTFAPKPPLFRGTGGTAFRGNTFESGESADSGIPNRNTYVCTP